MRRVGLWAVVVMSSTLGALQLFACGGDDTTTTLTPDGSAGDSPSGTDTGTSDTSVGGQGTVSGKVTYSGLRTGNLEVALFQGFTIPTADGGGGPTGLVSATEATWVAPSTTYSIKNVDPGQYYVVAYIGSRGGIGPSDPRNAILPPQVTVVAGQTVTAPDIPLADPPGKTDAGSDSGGDAPSDAPADTSDAG